MADCDAPVVDTSRHWVTAKPPIDLYENDLTFNTLLEMLNMVDRDGYFCGPALSAQEAELQHAYQARKKKGRQGEATSTV